MGFLKKVLPIICILSISQIVLAKSRPFVDFDYSGFIQGQAAAFLIHTDKPTGALDSFLPGTGAGGIYETSALIAACEFTLKTPFFLDNSRIITTAEIGGYKASIKEIYLNYNITSIWTLQVGLLHVPFGAELQQASTVLDTIERSAIYSFGNFGWIDSFGFEALNERDYGIRSDWNWPVLFAGFRPFIQTALVTGSGKNIKPSAPLQWIGRIGIANNIVFETFKHELILGLSGSHGWVKFDQIQSTYIPIGSPGDIVTHPQNTITETAFNRYNHVSMLGADALIRMNDLIFKGEWLIHKSGNYLSHGYYIAGIWELKPYVNYNITLVAKWEELMVGYANGAHQPDTPYQSATLGLNWMINQEWKWQLNYIKLLKNKELQPFYGSNLLLTQFQFAF